MGRGMTWHYCIGKKTDMDGTTYYHVIETYQDEDGKPWGWTFASLAYMDMRSTILQTLEVMTRDIGAHPVLDLDAPMPGKRPGVDDDL